MIKSIIFIILILELKKTVDADAWILPPQEKSDKCTHLKGCYVPELDKVLRYEQIYSPCDGKNCIRYKCNKDGNTYIYSCGVLAAEKGCKIVPGNKNLPYPKCCDSVKCKKHVPVDNPPKVKRTVKDPPIEKLPVEDQLVDTPQIENPPPDTPQIENPPIATPVKTFDSPQVGNNPDPDSPVKGPPVKDSPVKDSPVEDASVADLPVEETPVEDPPGKGPPLEDSPGNGPVIISPPNCEAPRPKCPPGYGCIDDPIKYVC